MFFGFLDRVERFSFKCHNTLSDIRDIEAILILSDDSLYIELTKYMRKLNEDLFYKSSRIYKKLLIDNCACSIPLFPGKSLSKEEIKNLKEEYKCLKRTLIFCEYMNNNLRMYIKQNHLTM